MLLRAEGERVNVDPSVRRARVVLVRLDEIEVGSFALREAVLSVELELGGNHWVLSPAVHAESGLGKDEGARVRNNRFEGTAGAEWGAAGRDPAIRVRASWPDDVVPAHLLGECAWVDEKSADNELVAPGSAGSAKGVVRIRKRVNAVSVVEWLHTKRLVQLLTSLVLLAAVHEVILLDSEDKLLARVVEIELDLVARGPNRFGASELELLDEVLVRVLCHAAALVSVKEDVVDVERGSDKGLGVGALSGLVAGAVAADAGEAVHRPQEAVKSVQLEVNLDLVVLESNQRKRETRVAAEPELERHVKGSLRKRAARGAHVARGASVARGVHSRERWVGQVGKLSGLPHHFLVTTLLLGGHGKLVPEVHPVAVLAVNALTTNLNLNVVDHVNTRVVNPPSPLGVTSRTLKIRVAWARIDLREHHLKVGAVGKVTIARNGALHTATEVGLTIESLFNRFHSKISVSAVGHFPESNLWVARKINILGTVSYKLHQSSSHSVIILLKKKKLWKSRFTSIINYTI